jgi:uncharacterized protein Yka (UPF0111/DUF47 family)
MLRRQAEITRDGIAAFARWSDGGAAADAQAVREAEHDADDTRHALLEALSIALTTPIEQEDAYALSERIDEVIDSAKDTVRIADALGWEPDRHAAAMAARAAEAAEHLCDAIAHLGERVGEPGAYAERAIMAARRIELELLAGLAELPRDGDAYRRSATLELYRSYSGVSQALLRVADRTWYAVLTVL